MAGKTTLKTKEETTELVESVFEEDSGAGFEETDQETFALPMITLLQSNSPQVDEAMGVAIPGAKAGMFYHNIDETLSEQIEVVPVHFRRSVIEWIPRREGGGFVGEMTPEAAEKILGKPITSRDLRDDKGKIVVSETGHELSDTRSHYVLVHRDGEFHPALISMTSTQLKKSRKWMTGMNQIMRARKDGTRYRSPMFANVYKLMAVGESNDQGSWFGYHVARLGFVDEHYPSEVAVTAVTAAKAFREMLKSGQIEEKREQVYEGEVDEEVGF